MSVSVAEGRSAFDLRSQFSGRRLRRLIEFVAGPILLIA